MSLENLPLVSPVGVSGHYILMGVSPQNREIKPEGYLFQSGNPAFVRIVARHVGFETLEENFLYEFYNSFDLDVRSHLSAARAASGDRQLKKEIIDRCLDRMGQIKYEAHLLSWGEICWSCCDDKKDKIEIFRFERDAGETTDPRLEILSKPLRYICPDAEIKYRIRKFQHQLCRQD